MITPSLNAGWLEALAFFVHNRLQPTVLLLDPASYGAERDTRPMQAGLVSLGAPPYVIRRELLDRPEARPGHAGEWEWRVTGFGRAILLALALACLVIGIQDSLDGLDGWRLWVVALAGLLVGWLLAQTRLRGWIAALLTLFGGVALAALWIGRLAAPLGRLMRAAVDWYAQAAQFETPGDKSLTGPVDQAFNQAWAGLLQAAQTVAGRALNWLQAFAGGNPSYDPLAVLLVWSLVAWIAGAWAGWQLRRHGRPLVALAPCGIILALSLAFSGSAIYPLIAWIGTAICLQAAGSYLDWRRDWQARRLDRAEIELEWGVAVGFLALALMSAALFAPSLSVQKLAHRVEQAVAPQTQAGENVTRALGVRRPARPGYPSLAQAQNPGLPNQRLLGAGPELSEQVVMWVGVEGYQPLRDPNLAAQPGLTPPDYTWRGATYERYTGRGWNAAASKIETIPAGQALDGELIESGAPYQQVRQHIQTASGEGGLVWATGELLQVTAEIRAAWREAGDLFAAQVQAGEYTVDSRQPQPTAAQLREAGQEYPDWVRRTYLAVPESTPRRVWELALDLTAAQPTPYDQTLAIERYLRTFPYTLEVSAPPDGRDVVDYFLFDLQRGYCDYYASAMVILARAAGLPARLATGYTSGTYLPEEARFMVTAADAHAWPEIYFPGYGWIEFEPTAGRPPLDRPNDPVALAAQTQPGTLAPPGETGLPPWSPAMRRALWSGLVAGLLLLAGGALAYTLRPGWQAPPQAIATLYRRLYRQARPLVADLPPGSTPYEFAAYLRQRLAGRAPAGAAADRLQRLVETYTRAIYSPHAPGAVEKRTALHEWNKLRLDLWWARFKKMF